MVRVSVDIGRGRWVIHVGVHVLRGLLDGGRRDEVLLHGRTRGHVVVADNTTCSGDSVGAWRRDECHMGVGLRVVDRHLSDSRGFHDCLALVQGVLNKELVYLSMNILTGIPLLSQ